MKLFVRDAARILATDEATIYRWIREGSIPAHKVNDGYRFHHAELVEWATARGLRVVPMEDEPGRAGPSVAEALSRGGVHYAVGGDDPSSVLRAIVAHLPVSDDADRDFLYDVLLAREALGSTGIGDGIAIPHARHPVVLEVDRPSITLCFLRTPVDFAAIDGHPVDTLFTLVTHTTKSHLTLLSRLALALHDEGFRRAVLRRAPAEEILAEARRVETNGGAT